MTWSLHQFSRVLLTFLLVGVSFGASGLSARKTRVVAIVDTGLDLRDTRFKNKLCKTGHRDFTKTGIEDHNGHGTHIAGLIKKYAEDSNYCLVIIKAMEYTDGEWNSKSYDRAMKYLNTLKVDYVNMSLSGSSEIQSETDLVANHLNTRFVVAAGNGGVDLNKEPHFPAQLGKLFPNISVVGSVNKYKEVSSFSNYGMKNMIWQYGENVLSTLPNEEGYLSGTSMATAITTGKMIKHERN